MTGKRSQHTCRISVHVIQQLGRSQVTSPTESWATLIHHTSSGKAASSRSLTAVVLQAGYKGVLLCRGPKGLERLVGLAVRKCIPCAEGSMQPMAESDAYKLRNQVRAIDMLGTHHVLWDALQRPTAAHMYSKLLPIPRGRLDCPSAMQVPGWRVEKTEEGTLCLRQDWNVRNSASGVELFKRIGEVAEAEGHHPDLHLEGDNKVSAELSTHSIGTLMSFKGKPSLLVSCSAHALLKGESIGGVHGRCTLRMQLRTLLDDD